MVAPNQRTRVLILYLGRRGAGPHYTLEVIKALLRRRDVAVTVVYASGSDLAAEFERLDVPSLAIDTYHDWRSAIGSIFKLPVVRQQILGFFRDNEADVVLATMPHDWNPLLMSMLRRHRVPYVATVHDGEMHGGDRTFIWQWWRDLEVRGADALVALTTHVRDRLIDRHGGRIGEIALAPHGPFNAFRAADHRDPGVGEAKHIVFFGRLLPYKGIDLLLDAYKELRAEGREVSLAIHGAGDLGSLADRMASLPDVIVNARYVPDADIPALMAAADVLVLPYREASQSGVIAIAQSIGMPIVVTPVGGLVEQIEDGRTGIVADEISAPALAKAIARFLDDPSLAERCARELRAAGDCLWEEAGESIAQLAKRLSDRGRDTHKLGD